MRRHQDSMRCGIGDLLTSPFLRHGHRSITRCRAEELAQEIASCLQRMQCCEKRPGWSDLSHHKNLVAGMLTRRLRTADPEEDVDG